MPIRTRLGTNLKRLRKERGWSQELFAFEAKVHRTYVSDLERGARNPSILLLGKLAESLDVPASALIADPGQR